MSEKIIRSNVGIRRFAPNEVIDDEGKVYKSMREVARELKTSRYSVEMALRNNGVFTHNGKNYYLTSLTHGENGPAEVEVTTRNGNNGEKVIIKQVEKEREDEEEYQQFRKAKEVQGLGFESYNLKFEGSEKGERYAVALFSDAHIEETVRPESVDFKNEYNLDIAEQRIDAYFKNLVQCLIKDEVDDLIFASLGDTISGFIHEELAQNNELTPIEATYKAQSLIYSGLKFIRENTGLRSIKFIGIVGNHSRTTKKIQHANGFKMSYEWLMYKNIEAHCKSTGLGIDFYLPESEIAIVNTSDGKKFIFAHGYQIKSSGNGTVCGIYPSLNRLSMKWRQVFNQDKIYIGHFHSCVSIPNATVNGSFIGYNSFALSNGFAYEPPAQMYEVYDTKLGDLLLTRKIYCK